MKFDTAKLNRIAETAKAKTTNKRWINAIDKAVAGLLGAWIVTELHDGLLVATESGETYHANGVCQRKPYTLGQPCKHRAGARLFELYEATPEPTEKRQPVALPVLPAKSADERAAYALSLTRQIATALAPKVERRIEQSRTGQRISVTRCNNWMI